MSFIFLERSFAEETKKKVQKREGMWESVYFELNQNAKKRMKHGPFSVVYKKGAAASGDSHDYFSEAPYWWPNPEDPDGPYIRRDGEYYLERFVGHREQMEQMAETVLLLAQAGYYLDHTNYMERAVFLLKVWFLEEETKMNPHLEYAQAIHGVCDGRGIGIIDTNVLVKVIHAIGYIGQCNLYQNEISGLKKWFGDYLHWMNTSKKGLEEKNYFNNHANWWNVQAAAYSALTDNTDILNECFDKYKNDILPHQLNAEGGFEDELTRTRSYKYCLFNLEACALTCEIAHYKGVDLWHFQTEDGKSIQKAIDYMLPYLKNPFLWKYEQIEAEGFSDQISLQLGGVRLHNEEYEMVNQQRRKGYCYIRDASFLGSLALLQGFTK